MLVRHATGLSAEGLLTAYAARFPQAKLELLEESLSRRLRREPLAYIIGRKEFYGRVFEVDSRVLIPRPESELLVEKAMQFLRDFEKDRPSILDVGTGSGVLGVTLAAEMPQALITAVDIDVDALSVARMNAERLGLRGRIEFFQADILDPLYGRFDVVVSNPPYVLRGVLPGLESELSYEPRRALDGGKDGMDVLGPLIASLPGLLMPGKSGAFIEIDPPVSGPCVERARDAFPRARIEVVPDLAGLDRCLAVYA